MPAWNELLNRFLKQSDEKKDPWIRSETIRHLRDIGRLRGNRHVIFYSSSFLQKPQAPPDRIQITNEDLNAFMSVMFGMDWTKGLTLLLHTPGGVTNAAETIVAYLHSKFQDIEVIVPTYAMSAGTMVSLGANRIVMGRQSQLGPIDPVNQHAQSAQALVDQFEKAGHSREPSYGRCVVSNSTDHRTHIVTASEKRTIVRRGIGCGMAAKSHVC